MMINFNYDKCEGLNVDQKKQLEKEIFGTLSKEPFDFKNYYKIDVVCCWNDFYCLVLKTFIKVTLKTESQDLFTLPLFNATMLKLKSKTNL